MALKQMEIQGEIERNNARLDEIESQLNDLKTREMEIDSAYKDADEEQDLTGLSNAIVRMDEVLEEKERLLSEKKSIRTMLDDLMENLNKTNEGETVKVETRELNMEMMDQRDAINEYIRTKDITRAEGFTSQDGEVIIPTEIIYQPRDEVYTSQNLLDYVNRVPVTTASGTYPILKKQDAIMHTVEELAENPELAKPKFESQRFDIQTLRGQLEIAVEAIEDAAVDLIGIASRDIIQQQINTTNNLILNAFKEFTTKTFNHTDDIKTILNVDIDPAYDVVFILSQTLFNELDLMKDADGRYYIQPDVTNGTVRRLFGHPVIVVRDELIGDKKGDAVGFVGDAKAGVTYFDRKQITARWVDNPTYGQVLMIGMRCDVKAVDRNAGYYISYTKPSKDVMANPTPGQIIISN